MAEEEAASFQNQGHIIIPPSRRIFFRTAETWNDGLLENAYALYEHLPLAQAQDAMSDFIGKLKDVLNKTHSVTLEGLGNLRSTVQGQIFFVAAKQLNLNPESFGLVPLAISPVSAQIEEETFSVANQKQVNSATRQPLVIEQQPNPTLEETGSSQKTKWPYYLLGAIGLILLLLVLVYVFQEPLRPVLEKILYSKEDLEFLHSLPNTGTIL